VRVILKEVNAQFSMIKEDYWQRNSEFLTINPAGTLPVLEESFGLKICGIYPIIEYFNEKYDFLGFIDIETDIKCEIRRLLSWINEKLYREVTKIVIDQKIINSLAKNIGPDTNFLRIARNNLSYHFRILSELLKTREFLSNSDISVADIACAAHISVLDYFGEINWDKWPYVRDWYSIIKSRPSFRSLLHDHIAGFTPPKCYADLDF
jgi:glutathione S-transferase